MKKIIILLAATMFLFSCKKEHSYEDFKLKNPNVVKVIKDRIEAKHTELSNGGAKLNNDLFKILYCYTTEKKTYVATGIFTYKGTLEHFDNGQ